MFSRSIPSRYSPGDAPECDRLFEYWAIGSRVIEPSRCLDQHVQAHQKPEGVLAPLVIDECLVDDQCTARWKSGIRLAKQLLLLSQVPIMQDVDLAQKKKLLRKAY